METNQNNPIHLKVSQKDIREFNEQHIVHLLGTINRIMNTCVYMIDYRTKKLIFRNSTNLTICGHPGEIAAQEGFNIYKRILPNEELQWLMEMQAQSQYIYNSYKSFEERMGFEFSFDLTAIDKDGHQIIFYQRLVPYRLSNDGHIWLALSVASRTPLTQKATKACIDNHVTGERYDYNNGQFILSKQTYLTREEIAILRCLANGLLLKDIGKTIGINQRTVVRKEQLAFQKLGVATQGAAVYKAKDMGLI